MNGYDSQTYSTAIICNEHIVANFITTGILRSLNENLKFDLDNGILTVIWDDKNLDMKFNKNRFCLYNGTDLVVKLDKNGVKLYSSAESVS